jgi:hypothetical protein
VEDADSGYTRCAGFDAHFGASESNSPECQDRDGAGGAAGVSQGLETSSWRDTLTGDDLAEDRGKENGIRGEGTGALDFFETVAGDRDDGIREAGGSVTTTHLLLRNRSMMRADVHAVGPGSDCGLDG